MLRSRLPILSLLSLFGALLMLPPELLLETPRGFLQLRLPDPGLQKALAFAVRKYNKERCDSANYFKHLRLLKAMSQVTRRDEYRLTVDLVKTRCEKEAGRIMTYKRIQNCRQLPRNQENATCYFLVKRSSPYKMKLTYFACRRSGPPYDLFISGEKF